ncbi:MFS transporter [Corynebacterium nuruki]|jgi:CP family cyanate transporter-like MFS transporter|uniref:MFS transporter n=1 Tax=Corynebacterium nuruki TaxID=1032851 RepID=A0A3D4SYT6_9CORY|nr:MFS transporter [Corynebacterium nuruki]HCT14439.1 MFS transporter [Corynebacterium nuruki]
MTRPGYSAMATRHVPTGLVVAGILLVAANLRAAITTVGPVLTGIEDDLGITSSAASFLVSLPLLTFAVVSPFVPRVAQRLGLEWIIAGGLVILAAGLVLRSVPPQALLWVGTVLIGVSIAVLNVVLPSWVKRDFPLKIGQITGAYSAVQSAFAAVAAGIAVPVGGATGMDWRLPLGMWAGLALVALGVLLPQLRRGAAPADGSAPAAAPVSAPATGPTAPRPLWRSALAWQVTAFMGLQSTNFYILVTWLATIETDAGISETAAGTHQFLLNGFGILGSIVCSALIARLRDQRVLGMVVGVTLMIATLGILLAPGVTVIWSIFAGIGGGAGIVLALSLFGLRTTDHTRAASLSGMAQSVGYLLAAAGPVAVGALHDATDSWTPALIVLLVIEVLLVLSGYLAGRDRTVD